ncbi:DUF2141 domain-containing protein [Winogradskyella bathintestinalis]|uniref:DUF2141 domain-containing protein n=1 Tax=Winogradskyella bathintestinalis TaxID=3035208 RepID=A0ABT7ZTI2_9FLAO|nr:DUF2141 domain-containing protein [Winogradskyella bathintestinalis]MDN3492331.1 DUF2141 domain-containing protein [Winogradskyella bathintestinalis]
MKLKIHKFKKSTTKFASKNLFLALALAFTTLFGFAQDKSVTVTVTINNVTSDKGTVKLGLHTADTFMKGKGLMSAESEIKDGKITVTFENVKAGDYAIIAFHDANSNGKMDFRDNGMPLESYGISNNSMSFGPPNYEDAKFTVYNKDLNLNIRF